MRRVLNIDNSIVTITVVSRLSSLLAAINIFPLEDNGVMVSRRLVLQEEVGVAGRRPGEVPAGGAPAPADRGVVRGRSSQGEEVRDPGGGQTGVGQHGGPGALVVTTGRQDQVVYRVLS